MLFRSSHSAWPTQKNLQCTANIVSAVDKILLSLRGRGFAGGKDPDPNLKMTRYLRLCMKDELGVDGYAGIDCEGDYDGDKTEVTLFDPVHALVQQDAL